VPLPDGSPRTLADAVPFREVYIHALVRDADRQKMSKTKGNVIDPIDVIGRFGTDAVRFTLASMASPGTDIAFSEERTDGYRAFANKIWNAARFLFMNLERAREAGYAVSPELLQPSASGAQTPLETRWIVSRMSAVSAEVERALGLYRFDEAAGAIYRFFWGEFCDWYLELIKLRLDFNAPKNVAAETTLSALVRVFEAALRLLSPFMPFLTEEIWHALYAQLGVAAPAKSIALTRFPLAADFAVDPDAENALASLQELIVTVRAMRKELGVPEKESTAIRLHAQPDLAALFAANAEMLSRLARVSMVESVATPLVGAGARSTAQFEVEIVYERQIDVVAERERLTKDLAKYEKGLAAAERQLGNEAFMARAPAHIVEGLRAQAAETRALFENASTALSRLPIG
jgi:valyl-tRNA synthetase